MSPMALAKVNVIENNDRHCMNSYNRLRDNMKIPKSKAMTKLDKNYR